MGMTDWIHGEDDETRSEAEGTSLATDGLGFDEDLDDFGDDFGDFGDDLEGFDDEADEFSGGAVDPGAIADLEDRVSDLENEVSATSSGMNTVREENKQIGETVEDLDDTIRKLLDIYEMVTRGINPFVDDAREMGGLEGGGSFGLFEAEEEAEEHLDPAVASADAESFFDEDFGELDADAAAEEAELAAEDELAENERTDPSEILDEEDPIVDEGESSSGGSSFEDLKAEYEEDGWEDEEDEAEEAAVDDGPLEADDLAAGDDDVPTTEELLGEEADDADGSADDADESHVSEDAEPAEESGESVEETGPFEFTEPVPESEPEPVEPDATAARSSQDASEDADVYLATLPASYVAESVALEWTQFLVSVGGAIGAARALRQYREQDWISRPVERQMNAHVRNAASATTAEEPQDLRVEHHKESLTYVSRLAVDVAEARLLEALSHRGGTRGLRR